MPALVATQRLAALKKGGGYPFQIYIDGVLYERVQDDATSEFLFDDDSNEPIYSEAA